MKETVKACVDEYFEQVDAIVFVTASGIAVRSVAEHLTHKVQRSSNRVHGRMQQTRDIVGERACRRGKCTHTDAGGCDVGNTGYYDGDGRGRTVFYR